VLLQINEKGFGIMRIFYMGNNWVGWQILKWLIEEREDIVGIAVHPNPKSKYRHEMLNLVDLEPSCIFDSSNINRVETISSIRALQPSIGITVFFGYIISKDLLSLFPKGCINIHPSFLPYNRGAYPNVWSIVDGTLAGATLHYVDCGLDSGDIIAQKKVPVEPIDTGESLYHKLESMCVELFKEIWPMIRKGNAPRIPQMDRDGNSHRIRDVEMIDRIELDQSYKARQLIDIIRARSFPPYPGAYFMEGNRKVFMRLQLIFEEDLEKEKGKYHDKDR
jgi:methionyl-tRNA formyltransferase